MEQETKESYEKKIKFESEIKCPHCGFWLSVKAGKKIIEPSKAAVTEDFFEIEESVQSKLETGLSVKDNKDVNVEKKKRGKSKKE